jgi:TM2 domain-containing membrane protein YozV
MTARAIISMVLAYLIPGAGHFYLGRRRRAAAFFGIVVVLFLLGLAIDGSIYTLAEAQGQWLKRLAALGSMGSGALYFIAKLTGPYGKITSGTFEYGTMFTLSAGMMNLLLVIDCFDIAERDKP